MLEAALRSQLLTIPDLTGIVGTRIYPVTGPEDLAYYPCLTMATVSYQADYTVDSQPTGFAEKRIVLNAWSVSYSEVRIMVEAIRLELSGYVGQLPSDIYSTGIRVFLIEVDNAQDFFETAVRLYRSSIHLMIQYEE